MDLSVDGPWEGARGHVVTIALIVQQHESRTSGLVDRTFSRGISVADAFMSTSLMDDFPAMVSSTHQKHSCNRLLGEY